MFARFADGFAALPDGVVTAFVFAIGLVFGSFLNVCIHRLPLGESVSRPRSRCPGCGASIPAHHNIPVLSWILLRGKCGSCGRGISVRYPLVELAAATLVTALWQFYGPTVAFAIAAPFVLGMLVLFFTDWDHHLLPDAVTLTGFATGLAIAWWNPFLGDPGWQRLWMACVGAALGSGFLWSVGAIYKRMRGVEAMGLGDVKMMAFVGAFAGPWGVVVTLFAGSIVGAVVGVLLIPIRGRSLRDMLPFGCFLAPAAVAAMLWGRQLVDWYLGLLVPGA